MQIASYRMRHFCANGLKPSRRLAEELEKSAIKWCCLWSGSNNFIKSQLPTRGTCVTGREPIILMADRKSRN